MVNQDKIEIVAELKDLMSGQFKAINEQVNKLEGSLSNLDKGKSSGGGIMGSVLGANLLTNGIMAAGGAIKDFAADSVQAYAKNEMYEARLTTLLKSREAALLALKQITADAARTPFDKESLVQGNSMLIGAGESASAARKSIMDLGNAIAATGGGSDELGRMSVNLAQIKSIGKASAMDIRQFMYANIPIYELLSKSMKKNVSEIKDMDISYKDLTKALSDARKEGGMFYEGLENGNKTLQGATSNLSDAWDQLKTSIGKSQSGILKDTVAWANGMVTAMNKSFERTDLIKTSIDKYGGRMTAYTGGSLQTQGNLEALANMAGNSSNAAINDKDSALKQKKFLESLLSFKVSEAQSALKNMNGSTEMVYEGGKFANEISVIRGALSNVNGLLREFNKKPALDQAGKTDKEKKEAKVSDLEKAAKANRPTQTYINIENLVRELSNTVSSPKEALQMSAEQVAKTLVAVVNDVSVLNQGN